MRKAVSTIVLLSMGCAGTQTIPTAERRPPVSARESVPVGSAFPDADSALNSTAVEEKAPEPSREQAEVEGDVFAHCAYGRPNYGEDPATDAKEDLAVVVLDNALPEVCPEPGSDCAQDVRMFHVATLSESGVPHPASLVGKRVRFKVSEFETAVTGHHHSRIMLWYDGVKDLGPASHRSLRMIWSSVKDDFLGISCKGYPR